MAANDTSQGDAVEAEVPALSRRRFSEVEEIDTVEEAEEWMTTFMDMITLLLVFFVMMMLFADFSNSSKVMGEKSENRTAAGEVFAPPPSVATSAPAPGSAQRRAEDATLAVTLRGSFESQQMASGAVDVADTDDAVIVEISDSLLFRPGEFELSPAGVQIIDRLALNLAVGRIFARDDRFVTVEGHTDSTRIATERIPSNWELSSNRANAVVRRMAAQGIEERQLRSVGYADTRPRAANTSPEDRAKNRRVTLVFHTAESARAAGRF